MLTGTSHSLVTRTIELLSVGTTEAFVLSPANIAALAELVDRCAATPAGRHQVAELCTFARWLGSSTDSHETEQKILRLARDAAPSSAGREGTRFLKVS
jgi:hypothetical protein